MADDAFSVRVLDLDQRAPCCGEIIERVGLLLALAVEIPAPALSAPPRICADRMAQNRDRPATAGWRQTRPASPCRRSRSHRAKQRRVAVRAQILAVQDRGPAPARRHARSPCGSGCAWVTLVGRVVVWSMELPLLLPLAQAFVFGRRTCRNHRILRRAVVIDG